ncbi:MAG: hypothetical protein ACXW2U_09935, partial [Telluria sp.]
MLQRRFQRRQRGKEVFAGAGCRRRRAQFLHLRHWLRQSGKDRVEAFLQRRGRTGRHRAELLPAAAQALRVERFARCGFPSGQRSFARGQRGLAF